MKKKRLNSFSLSFIDIMACGLGAVALMFIFIKESNLNPLNINMDKEVELINNKITITENEITEINNLNNIAI